MPSPAKKDMTPQKTSLKDVFAKQGVTVEVQTKIGEGCPKPDETPWIAEAWPIEVWILVVLAMGVVMMIFVAGVLVGRWSRVTQTPEPAVRKESRNMCTQSQCAYRWWWSSPRFFALSDREHGAFMGWW